MPSKDRVLSKDCAEHDEWLVSMYVRQLVAKSREAKPEYDSAFLDLRKHRIWRTGPISSLA